MKATYRVSALDALLLVALAAIVTPVRAARAQGDTIAAAPRVLPSATELRLADLYALAARSSPRIQAATAQTRAAEARIASAKRPPDPQLQLGFMNRSLPSLRPMDPLGMTVIQLMQMLPTPGKLRLAGQVASAQASAADARADDIRWDVRNRIAMAFYELYRLHRSLVIAQQTKVLLQDIAKTAQGMYAVGDGKQADVLRAQVEVARMTEEITRMESMRSAMNGRLAAALDVRDVPAGAPMLPNLPDSLPPLEQLVANAEANRPMIVAGRRDLDAAAATEALARKEIWPDLQVGVQYGWNRGAMGVEHMGSLMLGATVPIFARSRQLQMRKEAEAMRTMTAADLAAMRAETRGRITEIYADFVRARNLRALYSTTVIPQAQGAVTASFASYRVGDINLMTLLDNQMTVNNYRQEVSALEAEQGKAIAELEMLVGKPLFDPGSTTTDIARAGQ
jgi:outer membrane protein, heavy metal efflux system